LAGTETLPVVQSSTTKQVSVANLTAGRAVSGLSFSAANAVGFANTSISGYSAITLNSGDPNTSTRNWGVASTYNNYGDLCFIQSTTQGGSPIGGTVIADFSNTGGDFKLYTGNLVIGTSGKGIDFSAVVHSGSTSKLLSDYEQGTFTITISGSTSGSGTVAGVANYIKVGKIVTLNVAISNVTFPTYSGDLQIGLPFAAKSDSDGQLFGAPMYFYPLGNWTTGVLFAGWIPRVAAGASVITFQLQQVNADRQTLATNANTTTSATAGLYISFSLTYLSAT
jgi:hypothetical protein